MSSSQADWLFQWCKDWNINRGNDVLSWTRSNLDSTYVIVNIDKAANSYVNSYVEIWWRKGILSREGSPSVSVVICTSLFLVLVAGPAVRACKCTWVTPCETVGPLCVYKEMKRVRSDTALQKWHGRAQFSVQLKAFMVAGRIVSKLIFTLHGFRPPKSKK